MTAPASRTRPVGARVPLHIALDRDVDAPGIARAEVSRLCERSGLERATSQTLVLLVSEVVSNAVLHSSAPPGAVITMTVALDEETIRVTVTDAGDGFTPEARDPERIDGGYGLYLLDRAASCWGVQAHGPTSVWFELALAD